LLGIGYDPEYFNEVGSLTALLFAGISNITPGADSNQVTKIIGYEYTEDTLITIKEARRLFQLQPYNEESIYTSTTFFPIPEGLKIISVVVNEGRILRKNTEWSIHVNGDLLIEIDLFENDIIYVSGLI
jgi:hypothetical protein